MISIIRALIGNGFGFLWKLYSFLLLIASESWTTSHSPEEHKLYSWDIIYWPRDPALVRLMTCRYCRLVKGFFKNFAACDLFGRWGSLCGSWSLGTLQDRWGSWDKLAQGWKAKGVDGKIYVPAVFHLDYFFHNLVFPTFTVKCCAPRPLSC